LRALSDPRPPPQFKPYLEAIRARNPELGPGGANLRVYPGSPAVVRALLRPQDRLILVEMHPEDGAELKCRFARDGQVSVHLGDGYQALKGLVPPPERRGMALVDPPFEATNEFERLVSGLKAAYRRWPTGIYALWYPVTEGAPVAAFLAQLKRTGIAKQLLATLNVQAGGVGLTGCGMVVVNPPWRAEEELRALVNWLARRMGRGRGAGGRVEWLAPE
jgi:23S rRNA (adenine2030-N6)-methyltransferase